MHQNQTSWVFVNNGTYFFKLQKISNWSVWRTNNKINDAGKKFHRPVICISKIKTYITIQKSLQIQAVAYGLTGNMASKKSCGNNRQKSTQRDKRCLFQDRWV